VIKVIVGFLLVTLMFPSLAAAAAAGCPALKKQLARLRMEYQSYATSSELKPDGAGFDELAEILDKIVDVKAQMRKIPNCKIPPRPKSYDKDK
jgi:hypothetical protein